MSGPRDLNIGLAVRVTRAARGLTRADLATLASVSPSTISLIESGKRAPSVDVLEALIYAVDIPTALFMALADGGDDAFPPPIALGLLAWFLRA